MRRAELLCWTLVLAAGAVARPDAPPPGEAAEETPRPPLQQEQSSNECSPSENSTLVQTLKIVSDITHRYAVTKLISSIENLEEYTQETQLIFIIPESAYVSSFSFIANDTKYKGVVKSKEEAEKEYQSTVEAGQSTAQVTTSAREADVFTIIVNVEPKSTIFFNVTYEELLSRRHSLYDHMITIKSKQELKDLDIYVNIKETTNITKLLVTTGNETYLFSGPNNFVSGEGNSSDFSTNVTFHTAKIHYNLNCKLLAFDDLDEKENMIQMRVQYDVNRTQSSSEILFGDGYFVHFFAPENLSPIPLHIIFVLDTSTSMWGRKIEQLKIAMQSILGSLRKDDYFSLVHFGSDVEVWSSQPQETVGINRYNVTHEVNNITIDRAQYFISTLNVTGGTNINGALRKALELAAHHKTNLKKLLVPQTKTQSVVLLLSDGIPTNGELRASRILATTRARNTEIQAAIFSLSIGESANFAFLRKLSLQNHGFARRIYEASDTAIQLESFFEEISSPLLTNVNFIYSGSSFVKDSLTVNHFHSYFKGSEMITAGKINTHELGNDLSNFNSEVNGWNKGNQIHQGIQIRRKIDIRDESERLERLWAYLTIQQLINKQIADGGSSSKNESYRNVAKKLALKYKFVTPYTSLVILKPDVDSPFKLISKPTEQQDESGNFIFQNKIVSIPMGPFHYIPNNVGIYPHFTSGRNVTAPSTTEEPMKLNYELSDITWLAQHVDSDGQLMISLQNSSEIIMYSLLNSTQQEEWLKQSKAEPCLNPANDEALCQPLSLCVSEEFKDDYDTFLKYFCPIGEVAGVCCSFGIPKRASTTEK